MSLEAANREVYELLKDGITVSVPDREHGGQKIERLRVIDWEHPENNDFLLVSQFSVTGALYTCRPDLVGFVNGLPLVVIELKKPGVPARAAFDDNLTHYKQQIPPLFWFNALLIASNGTESRVGSLTADWERFFEWKRIEREDEPRRVSLEVMLRGTCDRARLLDLVENFTLFSEHKAGLVKILAQNHQFLGVNNAIASMLEARKLGHGRGGVFWQTQGSGKSFSMVFFAQKVLRKLAGNWTFVIVTDRVELDDQIAKTFKTAGAVSRGRGRRMPRRERRAPARAAARQPSLRLHADPEVPDAGGCCRDRADVIVLTDEAHRSQYDTLALNMRAALPKAHVPRLHRHAADRRRGAHAEVFGDYVSIYDFQQSVEDGATVPLFYENRTPELQLANPDLNDDLYALIEDADLDDEQEAKLETGARPPVPPDHPRRPAGDGRAGHRAALPRARLRRQGDGRVDRQGHRAPDVRQGAASTGRRRPSACEQELGELGYEPTRRRDEPEQAQRDARTSGAEAAAVGADDDRHGGDRLAGPERDRSRCRRSASTSSRTASG